MILKPEPEPPEPGPLAARVAEREVRGGRDVEGAAKIVGRLDDRLQDGSIPLGRAVRATGQLRLAWTRQTFR